MNKSPALKVLLFFAGIILLGGALLSLGVSRSQGAGFSAADALFTSASAVCGAGLSVTDIGAHYTLFGQIVLLLLIQCGALGYMLMSVIISVLVGKIALGDREIISNLFVISSFGDLLKLLKKALLIIFSIELFGAAFLTWGFSGSYGFAKALYYGIFHSVSAFCNAGMSVLPDSLQTFSGTPLVLYPVIILMFLGGLGFFVLIDLLQAALHKTKITYYSKIVITAFLVLTVIGFFIFSFSESLNLFAGKTFGYKINNSLFQIISAQTSGFNTLDVPAFTNFTAMLVMALMFIGAAPASAAGGVKITTLILVFSYARAIIRGEANYRFYNRTISAETVKKAVVIFISSGLAVAALVAAMIVLEFDKNPVKTAFETVSAFGINGLSMGITQSLGTAGKLLLILAMFAGRIGILTILVIMQQNINSQKGIKFPEAKVLSG